MWLVISIRLVELKRVFAVAVENSVVLVKLIVQSKVDEAINRLISSNGLKQQVPQLVNPGPSLSCEAAFLFPSAWTARARTLFQLGNRGHSS